MGTGGGGGGGGGGRWWCFFRIYKYIYIKSRVVAVALLCVGKQEIVRVRLFLSLVWRSPSIKKLFN